MESNPVHAVIMKLEQNNIRNESLNEILHQELQNEKNINLNDPKQIEKNPHLKNKKINKHKKKKEEEIIYKNLNPFKQQEKHYKLYQDRQTDFSQLFDQNTAQKVQIDSYTIYSLPAPQKGAYLIKGFNPPQVVNEIGYLALNQFWKQPYRTNLNSRNELYQEQKTEDKHSINQKKDQQSKQAQQNQASNQKTNFLTQSTQEQFQFQVSKKGYCFNDKIRWANVGHQYDWTLRKYPEFQTPMHPSIKQLTDRANAVFNKLKNQNKHYHPESAIVNYYGTKDYMTGHLDDAEYDQVSPIYSFSFGLSCIFLMGGITKDEKPLAVRLDSGDILIMSNGSRKCYHGVPRVISESYKCKQQIGQKMNKIENIPDRYNSPFQVQKYFQSHRVNINIRQVFPENHQFPSHSSTS